MVGGEVSHLDRRATDTSTDGFTAPELGPKQRRVDLLSSGTSPARPRLCCRRQASPHPQPRDPLPGCAAAQISSVKEAGEDAGPGAKGAHKKCHCCVLEVRAANGQ